MSFSDQFSKISFPNAGLVRFPKVNIADSVRESLGLKTDCSSKELLRRAAWAGYLKRKSLGHFNGIDEKTVIDRFKVEFEVFEKTGTYDYILMVWEVNLWCDQVGIIHGPGRGSAASSLTLYCLNVTNVNPIRYGLYFSRFLSEARLKPQIIDGIVYVDGKMAPDIDEDYEFGRREEVIRHLEEVYKDKTCKISTRLQLTGKMALKDVLKVYANYEEMDAKYVTDMIEVKFGSVDSLIDSEEKNIPIRSWIARSPTNRDIYEVAKALEGLNVARGQHPSGVFINFSDLDGNIPLELSKTNDIVTSVDMEVAATQSIKLDVLGLRTIDLIANTCRMVGITVDSIDPEDPIIYQHLNLSDNYEGFFQIEAGSTKEITKRVGPRNLSELSACVAISRPGAIAHKDKFIKYVKTGEIEASFKEIDNILRETGGVLIYQEQITQICSQVFGLSEVDADAVRYCVGKKKKDEMAKWEPVLRENAKKLGLSDELVNYFWSVCNASADYLFVKAHSYCYSIICALTVYLKAKYQKEFYVSMLRLAKEEPDSTSAINKVINEMRRVSVNILPPDLVHSSEDFTIEGDGVRFGLSSIKSVSDNAMTKLKLFNKDFGNKFQIFEAAIVAKIPINILVNLIYVGCLKPNFSASRVELAFEAQLYGILTDRERAIVNSLSKRFDDKLTVILKAMRTEIKDEKGNFLLKESRYETIKRDYLPFKEMYDANRGHEDLAYYLFEKHHLGFSYTTSLYDFYSKFVVGLVPMSRLFTDPIFATEDDVNGLPSEYYSGHRDSRKKFKFVCFVKEAEKAISKKSKQTYYKLEVSDDTGSIRTLLTGNEKTAAFPLPDEDDILIIEGSLSDNREVFFADSIIPQKNSVMLKKQGKKKE